MLERLSSSARDLGARLHSTGPTLTLRRARRAPRPDRRAVTGLDIEPGHAIAARATVNGSLAVEWAAGAPLAPGVMRDGEVADVEALAAALRELFAEHDLDPTVRVGVANQRVMVRTLELPPIEDRADLAAAVRFAAQDEIPMGLDSVVLDHHDAGVHETENGPRQRVVLVAARRDMVERLLGALEAAELRPVGIDVAGFALLRALGGATGVALGAPTAAATEAPTGVAQGPPTEAAPGDPPSEHVLYLSLAGLSNIVVAQGSLCVFTRPVPAGLEAMAGSVAERLGVAVEQGRRLVSSVGAGLPEDRSPASEPTDGQVVAGAVADVLRQIAAETRNSLDYLAGLTGGARVRRAVLCGPGAELPSVRELLGEALAVPLEVRRVAEARPGASGGLPASALAVAAGLSVAEVGA
jgi:type IV pilus assembly protein PilM